MCYNILNSSFSGIKFRVISRVEAAYIHCGSILYYMSLFINRSQRCYINVGTKRSIVGEACSGFDFDVLILSEKNKFYRLTCSIMHGVAPPIIMAGTCWLDK